MQLKLKSHGQAYSRYLFDTTSPENISRGEKEDPLHDM